MRLGGGAMAPARTLHRPGLHALGRGHAVEIRPRVFATSVRSRCEAVRPSRSHHSRSVAAGAACPYACARRARCPSTRSRGSSAPAARTESLTTELRTASLTVDSPPRARLTAALAPYYRRCVRVDPVIDEVKGAKATRRSPSSTAFAASTSQALSPIRSYDGLSTYWHISPYFYPANQGLPIQTLVE